MKSVLASIIILGFFALSFSYILSFSITNLFEIDFGIKKSLGLLGILVCSRLGYQFLKFDFKS